MSHRQGVAGGLPGSSGVGQGYREFTALSDGTGYLDGAAMGLDDMLDNRQTEPGSTGFSIAGPIAAIEAFKQTRQVLLRDTDAVINNADPDHVVIFLSHLDRPGDDRTAGIAVGDAVDQQIDHRLYEQGPIHLQADAGGTLEV